MKEQERLWKYTTEVLVPEAFIHQLTTRYDMDLRLADDIYTEHLKPPEKRDEHEILIDLEERVEEIQEENNDEITRDTKAVLRAVMRDLDELDATDEEENAHKPTNEKEAVMGKVLKAL